MKRLYISALLMLAFAGTAFGVTVKVEMNATSRTMTLTAEGSDTPVNTGDPQSYTYTFDTAPGAYILTGYASDGTTSNGTIRLNITDDAEQTFKILTGTVYATNSGWTVGTDYTVDVTVNSREGEKLDITLGNSTTAGRKTFLALNGNSYYAVLTPSAEHTAEGYMPLYKGGTLTYNVTVSGKIPTGGDYCVTLPADAQFSLGMKFTHFTDFQTVSPTGESVDGNRKTISFRLADGQVYNYRTWRDGGLTQAGYFYMNIDETKRPTLDFTDADYEAFGQKTVKQDVNWNSGYETGDIFVNINERGHLRMKTGGEFDAHAMRTWELTDNSTNNYFIEPDFHYTVTDIYGNPSADVITIDNADTSTSAWSKIRAVGKGTAIVTVTYDAIGLNYYGSGKTVKTPYMGGEYWSAIWPENTAVFVVTVDDNESAMQPNMTINEEYNLDAKKNAGKYIDAEHDVIYYLGAYASYTFKPEGVERVAVAYPLLFNGKAWYKGFITLGGVKANADGSYTVLLKKGRNIIRLTDSEGNSIYQVITAKPCQREISNVTRPGSNIFQPGDKVKIQYSGLRHPANKLAGIYNMSAYVTYNGIPNGSSLILGSGQYTFGSAPSAQAVTIDIPTDYDAGANPEITMSEGVIQVKGFGDPIGNHRLIDRTAGRSPNFTAVAHETYFGEIPDVSIPVSPVRLFSIRTACNVDDADITLSFNGTPLTPADDGTYTGTYGTYSVHATAAGYRNLNTTFSIGDEAEGEQTFNVTLVPVSGPAAWDGKTLAEPQQTDGIFYIATGAELAWFASHVNDGNYDSKGVLTADIDLSDFDWTPIGKAKTTAFSGELDGAGHTVSGLYINSSANYSGLFGYANNATIENLTVAGEVTTTGNYAAGIAAATDGTTSMTRCVSMTNVKAKQYAAGIAGYAYGSSQIDRCQNLGDITATSNYAAGITAYLYGAAGKLTNCHNDGTVTATGYVATLVATSNAAATIKHNLNTGKAVCTTTATTVGNVRTTTTAATNISDNYVTENYTAGTAYETVVTDAQLASGEVAYKLGEAWGQTLGTDEIPVIDGMAVGYDETDDRYFNKMRGDIADFEENEEIRIDTATGIFAPESDSPSTSWNSGSFTFSTYCDDWGDSGKYFYDFVVTNSASDKYNGLDDQYNAAAGGAKSGSNYAVWYSNFYGNDFVYFAEPQRPTGFYVTNTAWVEDAILNGDGISQEADGTTGEPFADGDRLTLTVTGYDENMETTGSVCYTLAEADGGTVSYVKQWRWVDLSSFADNTLFVGFSLDSTKKNSWGMTTPAYFCIDDFGGGAPEADAPMEQKSVTTGISGTTAAATDNGKRFDTLGRRTRAGSGIQIIRMPDGSYRKEYRR